MNLYIQTLLIATLAAALCGCAPKPIQGRASNVPIQADGNPADWGDPSFYYDADSRLAYLTASDGQNLYLLVRVADRALQSRIIRSGMGISFDTTGHTRQKTVVHFPLGDPEGFRPHSSNGGAPAGQGDRQEQGRTPSRQTDPNHRGHQPDTAQRHAWAQAHLKELKLEGFYPPLGGTQLAQSTDGVRAAIDWDSTGTLFYELVLPYRTFWQSANKTTDKPSTIGITIEVEGGQMTGSSPGGGAYRGDSGGGGMGGHHHGGGHHGGGMGGPGGGMGGGGMGGGYSGSRAGGSGAPAASKVSFRVQLPR